MAALGPILWWHSQLEGSAIAWFVDGDFVPGLPSAVGWVALGLEAVLVLVYVVVAIGDHRRGAPAPGKHLVVLTTVWAWSFGIVFFPNDLVFTVTNVLVHGIPYLVLVVVTGRRRRQQGASTSVMVRAGVVAVIATVWAAAFVEELCWDWFVYGERPWLLPGAGATVQDALEDVRESHWPRLVVIAVLSVPQITHYILDGFIWRRRDNAAL